VGLQISSVIEDLSAFGEGAIESPSSLRAFRLLSLDDLFLLFEAGLII
jgi:hypothetical protein